MSYKNVEDKMCCILKLKIYRDVGPVLYLKNLQEDENIVIN